MLIIKSTKKNLVTFSGEVKLSDKNTDNES